MKNCADNSSPLSLKDLAQIALGHGGAMKGSNIAVLHSIIQGILKKLNCENEVVTISGVKSEKLKALLNKANHPLLPCDQNLKVLTEKLNNLPELEKQIEKMEERLEKHLNVKNRKKMEVYQRKSFLEDQENWANFRKDGSQLKKSCSECDKCDKSTEILDQKKKSLTSYNSLSILPTLKRSKRFILNSHDTLFSSSSDIDDHPLQKSRIFIFDSSDSFSGVSIQRSTLSRAFYANWRQRLHEVASIKTTATVRSSLQPRLCFLDTKNKNKQKEGNETELEIETKCEEQTTSTQNEDSVDSPIYYYGCEDTFTIPSPENELPRALLKSPLLVSKLKEYALWPFERRMFVMDGKLQELEQNLVNCMLFWNNLTSKYPDLDFLFFDVLDLKKNVSNNEVIRIDTIYGMQDILDQKVDKTEIKRIKHYIQEVFNEINNTINQIKLGLKCFKTSAFIFETSNKLNKEENDKESYEYEERSLCECPMTDNLETPLIERISRMTYSDLQALKDRQNHNQSKQIRITSNLVAVDSNLEKEKIIHTHHEMKIGE